MNALKDNVFEISGGEITLTVHDETAIHLRSITEQGDPVELNSEEARELGRLLLALADRVG